MKETWHSNEQGQTLLGSNKNTTAPSVCALLMQLSLTVLTPFAVLAHAYLPRMRFHVIGIGSIGSLVSYHLRRTLLPQHQISLIIRRVNNHTEPPPNTPKRITIECN